MGILNKIEEEDTKAIYYLLPIQELTLSQHAAQWLVRRVYRMTFVNLTM